MSVYRSDVAFSTAVKRAQEERGSRQGYASAIARRDFRVDVDPQLSAFLATLDSFYLGTASADGQPYVQHRGGPPGFLKVVGGRRLAFADYAGNRQYISLGNLSENPKAFLFLMDYPTRERIKVWGRAAFVEGDEDLIAQVRDPEYDARVERVMVFDIEAWDMNCRQHIKPRYTVEEFPAGL